jgi:hypothetical protein
MQAGEIFRIVVRRGPQPNQIFELKDDTLNLGRDITNTITINDREVSRHHLRFTRSPEGYTIEDLGSTNGTFINGKRLSGAILLKNGDMIGLGETVTLGYEIVRPGMSPAAGANNYPATTPSASNPYQQPQAPAAPAAPAANPYQQPQAPQPNPYQPPQEAANPYQQPQAPASPYQQPQPAQPPTFGQQANDPYQQPSYGAPQDQQGFYAPNTYGAPPPPGYDYDPYAIREKEERSPMRLVLFGCIGVMVFCCCASILSFVLVDSLNLYCQIPVVSQVLEAVNLINCPVVGG